MPQSTVVSRRTLVKGMGALPLAAALGTSPLRAQNRTKVIVIDVTNRWPAGGRIGQAIDQTQTIGLETNWLACWSMRWATW